MSILSRFDKTFAEIFRLRTIPINDRLKLEERLVITCKTFDRLPSKGTPYPKHEINRRHWQKKAQRIYSEILTDEPHFYIPFILTISPKSCLSVDVGKICRHFRTLNRLTLNPDAKLIFEDIAGKHGIDRNNFYKRVILVLFGAPTTHAAGIDFWSFHATKLSSLQIFGHISTSTSIVSLSVEEIKEHIDMRVSKIGAEDAIICLKVEFDPNLIRALFPLAYDTLNKWIRSAAQESTAVPSKIHDDEWRTLQGVPLSALPLIFAPWVCQAVANSELGTWEKRLSLSVTDCVALEIRRKQPYLCILRLRIAFYACTWLANIL